jgi:EpsI family protein
VSIGRLTAIVILLAATAAVGRSARSADRIVDANLSALSYTVGGWKGTDGKPLDAKSVDELGADAYLTREYSAGAGAPIGVYIAFYGAQRPGVSVHSPLHCLPGTGWEPLDVRTLDVSSRGAGASGVNLRGAGAPGVNKVRRLVVRKNRDRAVVLYWYAVHGRVIAGEAISKLWLLHDSIRLGRSDAALVRIVVPVTESVEASERRGLAFTRDLLPYLSQLWS